MNWFYLENGAQRGPITEAEFPALFQTGVIQPGTYLWREGMAEWKTYGELLGAPSPTRSTSASAAPAEKASVRDQSKDAFAVTENSAGCSQCGEMAPRDQLMRIGSASLCPKCQVAYRRQAQVGFGDGPPQYANPFARLVASILDCTICSAVVAILLIGAPFVARRFYSETAVRDALGIAAALSGLWVLNYFVGSIARTGATSGMKRFRIRVVTRTGDAIGYWRALGRSLVIGLTNVLTFGVGHLTVFFDKQRRSLPDIVCGTIVIKR